MAIFTFGWRDIMNKYVTLYSTLDHAIEKTSSWKKQNWRDYIHYRQWEANDRFQFLRNFLFNSKVNNIFQNLASTAHALYIYEFEFIYKHFSDLNQPTGRGENFENPIQVTLLTIHSFFFFVPLETSDYTIKIYRRGWDFQGSAACIHRQRDELDTHNENGN